MRIDPLGAAVRWDRSVGCVPNSSNEISASQFHLHVCYAFFSRFTSGAPDPSGGASIRPVMAALNPCEPRGPPEFPSALCSFVLGVDSPSAELPCSMSSGVSPSRFSWEEDLDTAQVLVCTETRECHHGPLGFCQLARYSEHGMNSWFISLP